jgi:hypothetical protein
MSQILPLWGGGGGEIIALMMEAANTSEMSVNFYETTRCHKLEDKNVHIFSVLLSIDLHKDMKTAVFWVVAPCSLVEVYQRFRGTCCLHHQGDGKLLPD